MWLWNLSDAYKIHSKRVNNAVYKRKCSSFVLATRIFLWQHNTPRWIGKSVQGKFIIKCVNITVILYCNSGTTKKKKLDIWRMGSRKFIMSVCEPMQYTQTVQHGPNVKWKERSSKIIFWIWVPTPLSCYSKVNVFLNVCWFQCGKNYAYLALFYLYCRRKVHYWWNNISSW